MEGKHRGEEGKQRGKQLASESHMDQPGAPGQAPHFSLCLSFLAYKEEVTIMTSGDGHLRRTQR